MIKYSTAETVGNKCLADVL